MINKNHNWDDEEGNDDNDMREKMTRIMIKTTIMMIVVVRVPYFVKVSFELLH